MAKKDKLNMPAFIFFAEKSHPIYSQSDNFFSCFWKT